MTFASIPFIVYFLPVVLVLYYLLSFSTPAQNILLYLVSLVFYAWNAPRYWLLLVLVTLLNALFSYAIEKADGANRSTICLVGIGFNLALLCFYRYFGALVDLIAPIVHQTWSFSKEQPLGITVFTMHAIGYLCDVRDREIQPKTPFDVGITIAMFPFVAQGPMQRAVDFSDQLQARRMNLRLMTLGACRFVVGLAKVCILANALQGIADNVFSLATIDATEFTVPATLSWLGLLCFAMQFYYELSGISDMALGIGMLLGFRLLENFDYPFTAVSLTDFWHRWNTGVMRWMRRYVERPLYGEKEDSLMSGRMHLLSFGLTGLWYGTGLTHLLWGVLNGVTVMLEQIIHYPERMPRWVARLYTLALVMIGMVVYRSQDIYQISRYLLDLFCLNHNAFYTPLTWLILRENWPVILLGLIFVMPIARRCNERVFNHPTGAMARITAVLYPFGMLALFLMCIVMIVTSNYYPTL